MIGGVLEQVLATLDQPITSPFGWSKDAKYVSVRVFGTEYSEQQLPLC